MSWLYDEQFISRLFVALIVATPALAVVGAFIHRAVAHTLSRCAVVGWALVALAGPANFGLWHMYNGIEDYWGLDRVKPLLINLAIFIALGVAVGLVLRVLLKQERPKTEPSSEEPNKP